MVRRSSYDWLIEKGHVVVVEHAVIFSESAKFSKIVSFKMLFLLYGEQYQLVCGFESDELDLYLWFYDIIFDDRQ